MRACLFLLGIAGLAAAQSAPVKVASPDGRIEITFSTRSANGNSESAEGALFYRVDFRGKPVMDWSRLGLQIQNQGNLGDRVKVASSQPGSGDASYRMPYGKSNPIRDHYNSLTVELAEAGRGTRTFSVEARAYDDGVGFRYTVPQQTSIRELRIAGELTQFRFAKEGPTWPLFLAGYRTSYESDYVELPNSSISGDALIAVPFLVNLPGTAYVAVTEAHIENYAGMYLSHRGNRVYEAKLAPRADQAGLAVGVMTPASSPWRVLMIGERPGTLIESSIVLNLNPPCAIQDPSWVKPGKVAWDWWSGSVVRNASFPAGMNTDTMKHYIDFAGKAGLEYMLIDAGWALDAKGPNDSGGDITQTQANIDMPALLAYAKERNVKLWVWAHWTDVDRLMEQAFPLYEKWGLAGVKIDFMDRDDQWMVEYYHRVAKKAAQHHLMVDFHGAYKPDGIRRTWPNVITREAVMGLEYTKWSGRITPRHNVMLAYTRMLAGPMDYTPGGFENVTREQFQPRFRLPLVMGTRAHQTALFVVFESPLQMVADDPGAYEGQKELDFLKAVPATWEETRVLNGEVGEYISIARRLGRDWYVGAITNWNPREFDLPLSFLGQGEYIAEIYADGPDAATDAKSSVKEEKKVTSATVLKVKLAPGGGQAIRFRAAK